MTLKQVLFEGTPDADMTVANSGAVLLAKNGGTAKFSTLTKQSGATGGRWVATAQLCLSRYAMAAADAKMSFSGVVTLPDDNTAVPVFLGIRTVSDNNVIMVSMRADNTMTIFSAGEFRLITADGADEPVEVTTGIVFTPGAKYRITVVVSGGSTSASSYTLKVYTPTGTAPLGQSSRAGLSFNTSLLEVVDIGIANTGQAGVAVGWDDLQLDNGRTTEIPMLQAALATPVLQVVTHNPSAAGLTDGKIDVSWTSVPGAARYERGILPGTVTSGFTSQGSGTSTTHTFTNLAAGTYTVFVRAMPS